MINKGCNGVTHLRNVNQNVKIQAACHLKEDIALRQVRAYCNDMAESKKKDFENSTHILDEENEETLALLKQRLKSDKNRSVSSWEVRQQMNQWLRNSSQ